MSNNIQVKNRNGTRSSGITRTTSPMDLFQDLERQMDRLLGRGWPIPRRSSQAFSSGWKGSADVIEHDDSYEVRMDMPGVTNEDLEVSVRNNTLEVQAEREDAREEDENNYLRYSNKRQSHSFSFNLGKNRVEVDEIRASLDNGVLSVNLPKTESENVHKKISVE